MRSDHPRPLLDQERALITGFLAHDLVGVEELREQATHLSARRGCDCGCGTIEFVMDAVDVPRSTAAGPLPIHATVRDADGNEVGGLILFVRDGLLESLEIYSHDDPLPLPPADRVTWWA